MQMTLKVQLRLQPAAVTARISGDAGDSATLVERANADGVYSVKQVEQLIKTMDETATKDTVKMGKIVTDKQMRRWHVDMMITPRKLKKGKAEQQLTTLAMEIADIFTALGLDVDRHL